MKWVISTIGGALIVKRLVAQHHVKYNMFVHVDLVGRRLAKMTSCLGSKGPDQVMRNFLEVSLKCETCGIQWT
jgi:hypothetical protein